MVPNVQKLNSVEKCCTLEIFLRTRYGRHNRICNVEIKFFEKIFLNKEGLALLNVYEIFDNNRLLIDW